MLSNGRNSVSKADRIIRYLPDERACSVFFLGLLLGVSSIAVSLGASRALAACSSDADCEDGNPCTTNTCFNSSDCIDFPAAGASCDDGIFCNGADTCDLSARCSIHAGDPCPGGDGDIDCAESCDEDTDTCTALDPVGTCDGVQWTDDFDVDIGPDVPAGESWETWGFNPHASTECGSASGNAFYFYATDNSCNCRGAGTGPLHVPFGGTIRFWIRTKSASQSGSGGEFGGCDGGAVVRIEYSTNGGGRWQGFGNWSGNVSGFRTVAIPAGAQTASTRFRWVSYGSLNQQDHWALDDVSISRCGDGIVDSNEACEGGECCDADTCGWAAAGTSCGDTGNRQCDAADTCDGAGTCDENFRAAGVACGDGSDTECTNPDTCDGSGTCQPNHATLGSSCGDIGVDCLEEDSCDGNGSCVDRGYAEPGTNCGDPSDTECTAPDTCDGTGSCLDNHAAPGIACGDPTTGECSDADACDGAGSCDPGHAAAGTACGDATDQDCDAPDSCDGAGVCDANYDPVGAPCGDPTSDECTAPDTCDGAGVCEANDIEPQPDACTALDHYVVYTAKGSKLVAPGDLDRFPSGWNIQIDDVLLPNTPAAAQPDDPENYRVNREQGIVNPAVANAAGLLYRPDLHYVRYQLSRAREGAGVVQSNGRFPKTVTAPRREWTVENGLGDLVIETGKVSALWVPAGKEESPNVATPPDDGTHFMCYRAKAARTPSSAAGQNPENPPGSGKAKFRSDVQVFFADQFDDCAFLQDGATVPFAATLVEATCLVDLSKPTELCSPVDKSAVEAPRQTAAVIDESMATLRGVALVCYQAKLAKKLLSTDAAALAGLSVGDRVKQAKHVRRRLKDGNALSTAPGNRFPWPVAMDTAKLSLVCLPSTVTEVVEPQ